MFLLLVLPFLSVLINAQIQSPLASPEALQDRELQISFTGDSRYCDNACGIIASRLPSSLFLAKSGNFDLWDSKQSYLTPACRVEPSSSEEISFVLQTVIDTNCHFAIKSGGHDRTPGSSNAEGGVTIDLVRLNDVKVSEDRKSVKLGAGLRWIDVYKSLEEQGLMVVGGRVADVGVGGLILGGGISFFSNRYGLGCDNVLSYEIVLPDTSIQIVTQSSNPNLYRSLRGAGASNFGIVTSFTLETFDLPNKAGIWRGSKIYACDKLPELLKLNHKVATEAMDLDPDIAIINSFGYMQEYDVWWGIEILRHASHTNLSTWPEHFQPYEKIEAVPETTISGILPLSNITQEMAASAPSGDRTIYGTFTYHPCIALEQRILDLFHDEVNPVNDMTNFLPVALTQPLSRTTIQKMSKRGGNALGIAQSGEQGPLTIFCTSWRWHLASDDERSYAAYYRFMEKAETAAKEMGVWHPYKYINYAEETQDVWAGYGKENLEELRRVQRKVDPMGVFAKDGLGGGYFKLNDMPGKEEQREERMSEPRKAENSEMKSEL